LVRSASRQFSRQMSRSSYTQDNGTNHVVGTGLDGVHSPVGHTQSRLLLGATQEEEEGEEEEGEGYGTSSSDEGVGGGAGVASKRNRRWQGQGQQQPKMPQDSNGHGGSEPGQVTGRVLQGRVPPGAAQAGGGSSDPRKRAALTVNHRKLLPNLSLQRMSSLTSRP
jgi:hypothetical protein